MFFSLVVFSLLLVSGSAADDLDPSTEGVCCGKFNFQVSAPNESYSGKKDNIKYVS